MTSTRMDALACSRLRSCCRKCSRMRGRGDRSSPRRSMSRTRMLRTYALGAAINYGSSLSARDPGCHFGTFLRSAWTSRSHPLSPFPVFFFYFWSLVSQAIGNDLSSDLNLSNIRLIIPFAYQPRTRAPQPILSSPFPFLSTVKTVPEEWFQITSTIDPKVNDSDIAAIDVQVSRAKIPPPPRVNCTGVLTLGNDGFPSCLSQLSRRLR